jgi:heat shock protein HslJ
MDYKLFLIVALAILAVLAAGCVSQSPQTPATTLPTTSPPVTTPPTTSAPLQDPALLGLWYLTEMTGAGGSNPVVISDVQINIVFDYQNLSGFSGCNYYSAQYTLTGQVLPDGMGIMIGPIATTLKYCADISPTETQYLATLQDATSYTVNVNQQLSITDSAGSILVYERTPVSPLYVPPNA